MKYRTVRMHKYTEQLETELEECGKMPLFEIGVVDSNGKKEWITCDIFFRGNSIVAQRDPVSIKENKSKFIASTKLVVDRDNGLDWHLQGLHNAVLDDICSGDLFTLGEF